MQKRSLRVAGECLNSVHHRALAAVSRVQKTPAASERLAAEATGGPLKSGAHDLTDWTMESESKRHLTNEAS